MFHINSDGLLEAITESPFPSGGANPVSVGLGGDTLFVVNKNGDFPRMSSLQPNYTALHIASDGSLSPVSGSTVSVAFNSSPTQALVVRDHHLLFGADFLGDSCKASSLTMKVACISSSRLLSRRLPASR